ncbi:hypothetical protein SARC_07552 [Sphaeroforma arctica JP610]|uniref:Rho termination factor N-terminal domain-containing protein n=1 Tax=Sphaeroforma arctica JP610 TaxID=667725 RepID=A0A0L0FTH2_9EUKA|nr:hypothetical protein SARC_07552 [Sphaeroforma arctica JP610]KNC80082.1 hypothetical protein SARC_07552 [Sphaeroforma arctica JP610]|eukprot:XP_014153984.1 hypothetical protein SARC_07552 [Sphaeroforma arctica JP610]
MVPMTTPDDTQGRTYSICVKQHRRPREFARFSLPTTSWIIVGKKHFASPQILEGGKHICVSMDVSIGADQRVACEVQVSANIFLPAKLEDIINNQTKMNVFKLTGNLSAQLLENTKVYVLPNMTMATIIRLTKDCPPECFLKTYTEYRNYWRTNYGYELSDATPKAYVEVVFPGFPKNPVCYPIECIQTQELSLIRPVRAANKIAQHFVAQLKEIVILGCVLDFTEIDETTGAAHSGWTVPDVDDGCTLPPLTEHEIPRRQKLVPTPKTMQAPKKQRPVNLPNGGTLKFNTNPVAEIGVSLPTKSAVYNAGTAARPTTKARYNEGSPEHIEVPPVLIHLNGLIESGIDENTDPLTLPGVDVAKLTIPQLKAALKARNIKFVSKLRKGELVALLNAPRIWDE